MVVMYMCGVISDAKSRHENTRQIPIHPHCKERAREIYIKKCKQVAEVKINGNSKIYIKWRRICKFIEQIMTDKEHNFQIPRQENIKTHAK